jgi:hypothetical protein
MELGIIEAKTYNSLTTVRHFFRSWLMRAKKDMAGV